MSQKEKSIFWEVIVSAIPSKKLYMYMCPIPNGFRNTAILLYSSKIVDKKEILRTVYNTGIYCSSDKVVTVYLVQYILKIPPSTSMHFATRVRTWRVARLYSVQCTVYCTVKYLIALSRKPFGIEHMYIYTFFCLEWPILWPPRILTFPSPSFPIETSAHHSQDLIKPKDVYLLYTLRHADTKLRTVKLSKASSCTFACAMHVSNLRVNSSLRVPANMFVGKKLNT
jgi:hypothetical protein